MAGSCRIPVIEITDVDGVVLKEGEGAEWGIIDINNVQLDGLHSRACGWEVEVICNGSAEEERANRGGACTPRSEGRTDAGCFPEGEKVSVEERCQNIASTTASGFVKRKYEQEVPERVPDGFKVKSSQDGDDDDEDDDAENILPESEVEDATTRREVDCHSESVERNICFDYSRDEQSNGSEADTMDEIFANAVSPETMRRPINYKMRENNADAKSKTETNTKSRALNLKDNLNHSGNDIVGSTGNDIGGSTETGHLQDGMGSQCQMDNIMKDYCSKVDRLKALNRGMNHQNKGGSTCTGGTIGDIGGNTFNAGGSTCSGGNVGDTGGAIGDTGGAIGDIGGAIGETGGAIGETGGAIGDTGGSTVEKIEITNDSTIDSNDYSIPTSTNMKMQEHSVNNAAQATSSEFSGSEDATPEKDVTYISNDLVQKCNSKTITRSNRDTCTQKDHCQGVTMIERKTTVETEKGCASESSNYECSRDFHPRDSTIKRETTPEFEKGCLSETCPQTDHCQGVNMIKRKATGETASELSNYECSYAELYGWMNQRRSPSPSPSPSAAGNMAEMGVDVNRSVCCKRPCADDSTTCCSHRKHDTECPRSPRSTWDKSKPHCEEEDSEDNRNTPNDTGARVRSSEKPEQEVECEEMVSPCGAVGFDNGDLCAHTQVQGANGLVSEYLEITDSTCSSDSFSSWSVELFIDEDKLMQEVEDEKNEQCSNILSEHDMGQQETRPLEEGLLEKSFNASTKIIEKEEKDNNAISELSGRSVSEGTDRDVDGLISKETMCYEDCDANSGKCHFMELDEKNIAVELSRAKKVDRNIDADEEEEEVAMGQVNNDDDDDDDVDDDNDDKSECSVELLELYIREEDLTQDDNNDFLQARENIKESSLSVLKNNECVDEAIGDTGNDSVENEKEAIDSITTTEILESFEERKNIETELNKNVGQSNLCGGGEEEERCVEKEKTTELMELHTDEEKEKENQSNETSKLLELYIHEEEINQGDYNGPIVVCDKDHYKKKAKTQKDNIECVELREKIKHYVSLLSLYS